MIERVFLLAAIACASFLSAEEHEDVVTLNDVLSPSEALTAIQLERLALVERYLKRDPLPLIEGDRLTYQYGQGQPSLICAPFRICTVVLAPGERIAKGGLLMGAATMWHVKHIYVAGNDAIHIALVPKNAGIRSSLSILTTGRNARYYHIELLSDPEAYMPLIAFRYEDQALNDINSMIAKAQGIEDPSSSAEHVLPSLPAGYDDVSLDDLNFNYDVSGCRDCAWRPERVFDDGTRTFVVLPVDSSTRGMPALSIVGADSNIQAINSRFDDPSFIVDGLFEEARLSLGVGRRAQEVSIRRKSR